MAEQHAIVRAEAIEHALPVEMGRALEQQVQDVGAVVSLTLLDEAFDQIISRRDTSGPDSEDFVRNQCSNHSSSTRVRPFPD